MPTPASSRLRGRQTEAEIPCIWSATHGVSGLDAACRSKDCVLSTIRHPLPTRTRAGRTGRQRRDDGLSDCKVVNRGLLLAARLYVHPPRAKRGNGLQNINHHVAPAGSLRGSRAGLELHGGTIVWSNGPGFSFRGPLQVPSRATWMSECFSCRDYRDGVHGQICVRPRPPNGGGRHRGVISRPGTAVGPAIVKLLLGGPITPQQRLSRYERCTCSCDSPPLRHLSGFQPIDYSFLQLGITIGR